MRIPDRIHWQHLSTSDKAAFAKILLHQLPKGFAFNCVASFAMGSITNEVALFSFDNAVFALIPGAQIELGFDVSHWTPNPDELESWKLTANECGLELSMEEQIESATLRKRIVTIPPLLMEACAVEVGWQSVSIDEPEVRAIVEHLPKGASHFSSISNSNRGIRVTRDEFGGLIGLCCMNRVKAR
ncbi:hypothetical protein [Acaryochloris marina]|nr:hypothetical protein [Acaryochloris marina]